MMIIANDVVNKLDINYEKSKYNNITYDININDSNDSHSIICSKIKKCSKVLDFGAGSGIIGLFLKNKFKCYVDAIEIEENLFEQSKKLNCYNNIYKYNILNDSEYKCFNDINVEYDYIILADVLEHIYDVTKFLNRLLSKLKFGGKLLISIPNFNHYDVIKSLINGDFNYSNTGILDNTHIRFFTRNSFVSYIQQFNLFSTEYDVDCEYISSTSIIKEDYKNETLYNQFIGMNHEINHFQNIFELTKIHKYEDTIKLNHENNTYYKGGEQ